MRIRGQTVFAEQLERKALQRVADQQRRRFIELDMTGRLAATQDVVIHAWQIIVHQRIGVNDFNRSAGHRHAFGISLRQFTGGVGQ